MREQCRGGEGGDGPPELPPRPPHLLPLSPRPPAPHAPAYSPPTPGDPHHCTVSSPSTSPWYSPLTQKYVLLTLICGGLSVVLGALFMAIYLTVKSTTTSLHYFQTIPTYVPAIAVRLNNFINSLSKVRLFCLSVVLTGKSAAMPLDWGNLPSHFRPKCSIKPPRSRSIIMSIFSRTKYFFPNFLWWNKSPFILLLNTNHQCTSSNVINPLWNFFLALGFPFRNFDILRGECLGNIWKFSI